MKIGMALFAVAGCAASAFGQTRVLVSDTGLDQIVLLSDRNGDGDFNDADEVSVFFDASNASGLGNVCGSVFSIRQLANGVVLIGDGDTDAVYALLDRNGDGDANDANEAWVYYSGANGFWIQTPNSLATDGTAVYIATAGASPTTADAVVRCVDLNGDGDADDADESSVWIDLSQVTSSTPFGLAYAAPAVYLVDLLSNLPDVVWRAEDADHDGVVNISTELTTFADSAALSVPLGFGLAQAEGSFYVIESSGSAQRMTRLTDSDASKTIATSETTQVWSESLVGSTLGTAFDLAVGRVNGVLTAVLISSGADAADGVYVLRDTSGDGKFDGVGESIVALGGRGNGVFPETLRAVSFYAKPCVADFNGDGFADGFDYDDYVACFEGEPCPPGKNADTTGDGFVDGFDYDAFVEAFEAGC